MIEQIKILLEIDGNAFDEKLNILIPSAKSKLKIEGVEEVLINASKYEMYLVCVSYEVAKNLDIGNNFELNNALYSTYVEQLRSDINV